MKRKTYILKNLSSGKVLSIHYKKDIAERELDSYRLLYNEYGGNHCLVILEA